MLVLGRPLQARTFLDLPNGERIVVVPTRIKRRRDDSWEVVIGFEAPDYVLIKREEADTQTNKGVSDES